MARPVIAVTLAAATATATALARADDAPLFFDDFDYPDVAALAAGGWTVRTAAGHPGVPGARWGPEGVSLVDEADGDGARRRLLRLTARTDGTPAGTHQAQVCHRRQVLAGTYAARLRWRDVPESGADGDPVIESFYAVGDLRFPLDPLFSEVDWEYLPNGGWGRPDTRLYGLSWQTVQVEPWLAFNSPHEEPGSHAGWHLLTLQVDAASVRMFVDDRRVATHAGRNVPVTPMAIAFNLWFSPGGLLPPSAEDRVWAQDVDWVMQVPDRLLAPAEAAARVSDLRARGVRRLDTIDAPVPPLPAHCDL